MEDKMIIDLADIPPVPIVLGLAGENNFRSFTFDASTWGAGYPSARYNVVYKRPDGYLYPVVLNADTDELVWSPNATDTAVNGDALVEVRLLQGDVVGKTVAMQAIVLPSISGDESEPDKPAPDWVNDVSDDADRAEAAVEHYPQIRNGYWWVWDVANGEWVNTGVKASGEGGSATVIVTIDESTDPMTASMTATEIKAAVDDGKRVVLQTDGAEIPYQAYFGSLAVFSTVAEIDSTEPICLTIMIAGNGRVLPSATSLARMSDIPSLSAYRTASAQDTIDAAQDAAIAAKYTKPSGGIPKADLASAVQTSLGKADTALQQHQSLAGYATESYVQTQIAAIPDELPADADPDSVLVFDGEDWQAANPADFLRDNGAVVAQSATVGQVPVKTANGWAAQNIPTELPSVTASDNGKFLRVVSGAWAAQTVPSAEGASF